MFKFVSRTSIALASLSISVTALSLASASAAPGEGSSAGRSESSTLPKIRESKTRAEFAPHVGVLLGFADRNGASTNASYTLDVGFQPVIPFGYAVQVQHTPGDISAAGRDFKYNTTNFLMKGTYNMGGNVPVLQNSYLGAKAGAVLASMEGDSNVNLAIGPTIGFDIPVDRSNKFSLGAEAAYLAVLGENAPDQASLLGSMKYWF